MNKTYAQTKYNVSKCSNRRTGKKVKYIVVHYTGTTAPAENNCIYFSGGNRNASADYFIDTDGSIYKFNADCANYYSWHCGDGGGKYGIMNSNSIGIEVVSAGAEYTTAQKNALRSLVTAIMADYGVSASNVVRHYDASRKLCPAPYCGTTAKNNKWAELKAYITRSSTTSSSSGSTTSSTPSTSTSTSSTSVSYTAKVTADVLNVRAGAGTNYKTTAQVKKGEVYTIVAEASGTGASKWGKLKSGVGWVSLDYMQKVSSSSSSSSTSSGSTSYKAKVTTDVLNVRAGAGTNYKTTTQVKKNEVYTIVAEKSGAGSTKGWGKLKSGAGWVSLDYMKRM